MGCVLYEAISLKPPFRAEDMQGLFNKVIKGEFQRIPRNFSSDLNALVSRLLTIDPQTRPSCDEIMDMPLIAKRVSIMNSLQPSHAEGLLDTILLPKNIKQISERLPAAKYAEESRQICTEPDQSRDVEFSLPKINLQANFRGRVGLTPDDRMFQSRIIDNDRRKRDLSDPIKLSSPSKYQKKILRENYGGLQIVRKNRINSLSRPNHPRQDISAVLEASYSPKAPNRGRKLRYMSSHARPLAKLPMFESHNSRVLKMISEEESGSRKNLSVKSSIRPLP
jgi:serine/threonine protein kinase